MTHPLTKTVMKLNSFHSGLKAMKEIFYSRQHFPKILGSVTFCSCIGGYMFMDNLYQKRLNNQRLAYEQAWDQYNRENELRTEKYDTVIKPTRIQRRKLTKSSSYTILGSSKEFGLNQMILSPE